MPASFEGGISIYMSMGRKINFHKEIFGLGGLIFASDR